MALILARSPFFVSNQGFDEGALLTVDIGIITEGLTFEVEKSYSLNFRKQSEIDISQLVLPFVGAVTPAIGSGDYDPVKEVRTTVSGEILGVPQSDVIEVHIATSGYYNYNEGYNADSTTELVSNSYYAGSNDVIYKLDDENVRIPLLNPRTTSGTSVTVDFVYKGEVVDSQGSFSLGDDGDGIIITQDRDSLVRMYNLRLSFPDRVIDDGGVIENSRCLEDFFDEIEYYGVDSIVLSNEDGDTKTITVIDKSECKYTPYRVSFLNKYGVEEDIWFFKRSEKSLSVSREQYRRNIFSEYSGGSLTRHQYSNFNVSGRETMVLNSDWVPESFYENFKQLYLSEVCWIYINNQKLPINIKGSELQEKLHVNDKVLNYEIEIEFAFDTIGNIV